MMKSRAVKIQTKPSPKRLVRHRNRAAGESPAEDRVSSGAQDRFWMLCPRCGMGLIETVTGTITTERCTACGAVWADRHDVERLPEKDTLVAFKLSSKK